MSLEDLREQGVLLPEEEWGTHRLETTVHQIPLLVVFLTAAASLAAVYVGNGQSLTWIGIAGFFVAFFAMVGLCNRAVQRQRRRFQREHENVGPIEE